MNTYQITYRNTFDLGEYTTTFEATSIYDAATKCEIELIRLVNERALRRAKREVIAVELMD